MKWIIWTMGGVVAVVWTGALALTAWLVDWTGEALVRAGTSGTPAPAMPAELPALLAGWIDPAGWTAIVQTLQQGLGAAQSMLPAVGTAAGWLEPVVWVLWGLGLIAVLALAAGSHWLFAGRAGLRQHSA